MTINAINFTLRYRKGWNKFLNKYFWKGFYVTFRGFQWLSILFVNCRTLRRIVYSQAIIYFTASLILTIIAFVGSTTFITKPLICYIFGKMLQYFTLTTFCWMLVQAVNLYRAIVVISVRRTDASYLKWMSVFAWGNYKS